MIRLGIKKHGHKSKAEDVSSTIDLADASTEVEEMGI